MSKKSISLFSLLNYNLSYKLQKYPETVREGYLGNRQFNAVYKEGTFIDDITSFEYAYYSYTLDIEDPETDSINYYHLKLWENLLHDAFNGRYDNNVTNDNSHYSIVFTGVSPVTFSIVKKLLDNYPFDFTLLPSGSINKDGVLELCIASKFMMPLDKFLKLTYIILFIATININKYRLDPELIFKINKYIFSLKLEKKSTLFLYSYIQDNLTTHTRFRYLHHVHSN